MQALTERTKNNKGEPMLVARCPYCDKPNTYNAEHRDKRCSHFKGVIQDRTLEFSDE